MNPISRVRFDALAGYSRRPSPFPYSECEWYEIQSERVLGVIVLDGTDSDFAGLALGRDQNRWYRAVGITSFCENIIVAREALSLLMEEHGGEDDDAFSQGDEWRETTALLKPMVPKERMAGLLRLLISEDSYSPARGLIEALSPYFRDLDGNFIEQFQTTAFDARIFELYVFATLHELGYTFDQNEAAPDYHCVSYGIDFFVEALTVQPTAGAVVMGPEEVLRESVESPEERIERFSIKLGSALFTKLQKQYWKRPHVVGRPLVFAIQNFSEPLAMMSSSTPLANYLYGWRHTVSRDTGGHLVITPMRICEHRYKSKVIPSGFFSLEGADNVSAVIFNPHATLPKFNRMGILAEFGSREVNLIRRGTWANHDPNASEGVPFAINVRDPEYAETWVEGLNVYHNPRARFPIDEEWLPGAAHHFLQDDGQIMSHTPEFFPLGSVTFAIGLQHEGAISEENP